MIELKNVSKIYKQKKADDVKALDDVSLTFNGSGLTFIVGPSGSGKSTLLNVIGSLDKIDDGKIIVDDLEISKLEEKELNIYRNNHIGFIFQDYNLLLDYNVHDNIDIALELQGINDDKKIDSILSSVGIEGLNLRKIDELSGGEKQRVAIARALIKNPKIILADEPTGNLDSKNSIEIIEILKSISKSCEVIVVSHNLELAKKFADRIIVIRDGRVAKDTGARGEEKTYEISRINNSISYKKLFKISLTNVLSTKKKTIFTILLLSMSLMFMAFTLNISIYDSKSDVINTMKRNDEYFFSIVKYAVSGDIWHEEWNYLQMDDRDIDVINKIIPYVGNPTYIMRDSLGPINFKYGDGYNESSYYNTYYVSFEEILNEDMIGEYIGNIPTNSREIMITNHTAEGIMKYGVMISDDTLYKPESFDKLLEDKKKIKLGNDLVVVVGIVINDNHQFDEYKESEIYSDQYLEQFYNNYGVQNEHIFVKGFTKDATPSITDTKDMSIDRDIVIHHNGNSAFSKVSIDDDVIEYYNSNGEMVSSKVKDKDLVITLSTVKQLDSDYDKKFNEYRSNNPDLNYYEAFEQYFPNYIKENSSLFDSRASLTVGYTTSGDANNIVFNIIGVSLDETSHVSSAIFNYIVNNVSAEIMEIKFYEKDMNKIKEIFDNLGITLMLKNPDSPYYVKFRYINAMYDNKYIYEELKTLITIVLVISSLFALAMLYNLIKTNINDSKVKIGTLKALGMNNKSSLLIFINEYIIIDVISCVIGIILWILFSNFFNIDFFANPYLIHDAIVLEPIVILYVLFYVAILSYIALATIMRKINNIKPIDSILKRDTK